MQLITLYKMEGGRCFICKQRLSLTDASIEHLVPISLSGKDKHSNLVLICRQLNGMLANFTVKRKLEIIFNQVDEQGVFHCPMQYMNAM